MNLAGSPTRTLPAGTPPPAGFNLPSDPLAGVPIYDPPAAFGVTRDGAVPYGEGMNIAILADTVRVVTSDSASHHTLSTWGIVWLIVFVIWALACGGAAYNPTDNRWRYGFSGLLIVLVGMLGANAAWMISFIAN